MLKKAKAAFLLILALVFALQGVETASAETVVWTKEQVTKANLIEGLGMATSTGVVTKEFVQESHSEANLIADTVYHANKQPLLVSGRGNAAMGYNLMAVVELPIYHFADEMTFRVYTYEKDQYIPTELVKTVDVEGKTEVEIDFGKITDIDLFSKDLYVFQEENGAIVPETGTNLDELTPDYGGPVSGSDGGYVYIGSLKHTDTPEDVCKIFQNPGEWTGPNGEEGYISDLHLGPAVKLYKKVGDSYDDLSDSTGTMEAVDKVYIRDDSWAPNLYQELTNVTNDGSSYVLYGKYNFNVVYEDTSTMAADLLVGLTEFSWNLANSKLGLGGTLADGVHVGDAPSSFGNAKVMGAMTDGAVVSLYRIDATDGTVDQSDLRVVDSNLTEENKSEVVNQGIPIADNEYIVFNVVVPSGCTEVTFTDAVLGYRTEAGTTQTADQWEKSLPVDAMSRVIWNVVTEENGKYVPFTGTVQNGQKHGGVLLAPKATIEVTATANATNMVAEKVIQHKGMELHQLSFNSATVKLRMTNTPAITVKGDKKWEDVGNEDKRPDSVTVYLYARVGNANKELVQTIVLPTYETGPDGKQHAKWNWSIEGLPKQDRYNRNIIYSVEEKLDFSYYTPTIEDPKYEGGKNYSAIKLDIKNKYDEDAIAITGNKVWDDANNQDGKRPSQVQVTLQSRWATLYDGQTYNWTNWADHSDTLAGTMVSRPYDDTVTLSDQYGWNFAFSNLNSTSSYMGSSFVWEYRLVEEDLSDLGYTSKIEGSIDAGYTITNTHIPETIDISGTKRWQTDGADVPVNSVTVRLKYADGTPVKDASNNDLVCYATADNGWTWAFTDLPRYKNGGEEIKYTVTEDAVQGYFTEIINTGDETDTSTGKLSHTYEIVNSIKKIKLQGNKDWDETAINGNTQYRKDPVIIEVYRKNETATEEDDTLVTTVQTSEYAYINNVLSPWQWAVELPKVDPNGKAAEYYIKEVPVPNYTPDEKLNGTIQDSHYEAVYDYTVTNTIKLIDLTVKKEWAGEADTTMRPAKLLLTVQRSEDGGNNWSEYFVDPLLKATLDVSAGQTEYTFTNLVQYKDADTEYLYRIKEDALDANEKYISLTGYTTPSGEVTDRDEDGNITYTLTNTAETVEIKGTKVWRNYNGTHPDKITLRVYYTIGNADPVQYTTKEIIGERDAASWNWTITGLPKYIKGQQATYTIQENYVTGYQPEVTGDMYNGFTVTNTRKQTGNIQLFKLEEGTKKNVDGAKFKLFWDEDCKNPVSDQEYETDTVRDGARLQKGWFIIRDMVPATYWVLEVEAPAGYELPVPNKPYKVVVVAGQNDNRVNADNGGVVYNKPTTQAQTGSIALTKVDAADNSIKLSGAVFAVQKKVNGEWEDLQGNSTMTTGTDGVATMTGLEPGTYRIKETTAPSGYKISEEWKDWKEVIVTAGEPTKVTESGNVPNEAIVSVTVTKNWVHTGNLADNPPTTAKVQLLRKTASSDFAEYREPVTINGNGTHEWHDLPKYNENGEVYSYTVKELELPFGYVCDLTAQKENDYILTNTYLQGEIQLQFSATKTLDGGASEEEFTFQLEPSPSDPPAPMPEEADGLNDYGDAYVQEKTKGSVAGTKVNFDPITLTSAQFLNDWQEMREDYGLSAIPDEGQTYEMRYRWHVFEVIPEPKNPSTTYYDEARYEIGITITADGKGNLRIAEEKVWNDDYTEVIGSRPAITVNGKEKGETVTSTNTSATVDVAFTNTVTDKSITVTKKWIHGTSPAIDPDLTNKLELWRTYEGLATPENVTAVFDDPTRGTENVNEYSWTGLPAYYQAKDKDGNTTAWKEYTYFVKEAANAAPGYDVTYENPNSTEDAYALNGGTIKNTYAATGAATLQVKKVLSGRPFAEGDSFAFTLTAKPDTNGKTGPLPAAGGEQVTLAYDSTANTMKDTGSFGTIQYTTADIGNEYIYIIKEDVPVGAKDNGDGTYTYNNVTYDAAEHTVTVKVEDNGNGTLTMKVDYGDDSAQALEITNTYTGTTSISVTKVWNPAAPTGTGEDDLTNKLTLYKQTATGEEALVDKPTRGTTDATKHTYTWTGLDEYDDNNAPITYYVKETGSVPGYVVTYKNPNSTEDAYALNGGTITNTIVEGEASITINKTLVNKARLSGEETFTFNLYEYENGVKGATPVGTASISIGANTKDEDQTKELEFPLKYGEQTYWLEEVPGDGVPITYDQNAYIIRLVAAVDDDGTLGLNDEPVVTDKNGNTLDLGFTYAFTNTVNLTDVSITKKWVSTGTIPGQDKVTMTLYSKVKGAEDSTATVVDQTPAVTGTDTKDWQYTWTNLPTKTKVNDQVVDLEYFVKETPIDGYNTSYSSGSYALDKGTITNTEIGAASGSFTISKSFAALANADKKSEDVNLPASFQFDVVRVMSDGKEEVVSGSPFTVPAEWKGSVSTPTTVNVAFPAKGTYTYKVTENTTGAVAGVIYDESCFTVEFVVTEVTESGVKKLQVTGPAIKKFANSADTIGEAADSVSFCNYYDEVEVNLTATKKVQTASGAAVALKDDQFSLKLVDDKNNAEIKSVPANGTVTFDALKYTYADLEQEEPDASGKLVKKFTYTVSEVIPEKKEDRLRGYTYDSNTYPVEVTLTYTPGTNGAAPSLTASAEYNTADGKAPVFTNTYAATGEVELKVKKVLSGRPFAEGDSFTFTLSAKEGQTNVPMPSVTEVTIDPSKNADAMASFGLINYTEADAGKEYVYIITEKAGDLENVSYDTVGHEVTVKVEDKGDGTMTATPGYASEKDALEITNTYFAAGEFTLDVEKQMIGRSFQQGDSFTIAVTGSEGAPMPEKTSVTITPDTGNTAKVDFGKISYDELDVDQTYTYTYTVKEQPGTQNGVTYDLADHTVTVQVTKAADGTLSITPTYEDGEKVIIKNTYEANGKMELAVTKELKGREAVETDAFTFLLTGSDGAPMPESAVNGVAELTLNLSKETTGTFAPIAFKQEDEGKTYTYTVTEKKPAEGEDSKGIQYSGESYTITAVIADNGLGVMEATKTIVNSKGEKVDAITFVNTYAATGALDLEGRKTLTGRTLKAGEFTFAVEKADGTPVSTATHKADGTIEFQPIQYTLDDLGDHTYIIYEKVPATTDAAYDAKVKYDENKYTVTVTVADETKDGKLEVTVKAGDPKALNFTNTYGTSAAVQFKATKVLDKATLTAEQFSFQLIGEADSVLQTKNNAADGSVTFDSLSYTLEDMKGDDGSIAVSKQISYTIREVLPEGVTAETPTKDNITYDTTEHKVTVDLAYNAENGELTATTQYNTADGKAPVFTNTYTEATTMLMVTKVWAGDSEADRPDEITLNLAYRAAGTDDEWTNYPVDWDDSGAIAKATIVQDDGSWDIYIDGLPKRMDGKEVEWSATETVPAGYAAAYTDADGKAAERAENGATITNTYEAETYSLVLEKTDKLDPSKKLPDAVYTVYTDEACDEAHKYAEITTGEDGTGTLTDVPAGTYWVKETKAPDGYQVDPKAYPVTVPNAEDPTKPAEVKVADYPKTSVSVTKVWVGAPDGVTLPEITVQLLADGEVVTGRTLTLNAANNWNGKFTELDSHDATTGKAIAYTVKEKKVNGYTSQITGDAATGYTITNTYESKVSVQLKATKILEGAELQAEQFAFVMRLANGIVWDVQWNKADGSITFADVTYKKAGVYTFTIMEEIPDEKEEGYTYDETVHTVVVTVVEDPITKQLSATVDYGDTGEVVFTNTYAEATTMLMVTKVWAGDSEADRPDEITLNLAYRAAGSDDEWTNYPVDWDDSGAIAKATIVQDDGSWDIYIDGLPKRMDGKEVEWSATETVPAGYAAAYTDADGKAAERAENGATITNTYEAEEKLGKLMLSKSDRLNPSKKLSGAEYTVFTQETCKDEEILILPNGTKAIITTGEDGWGTLTGVPAGTYWVKETKAPVGYEVDPLPYKVVVEADAEEPVQVEVTDFPLRGALSLSKTVVGANETEESFLFDIVLNNAKGDPIVGSYEATLNGTETKAVAFVADGENAKATVSLKDGETLVIHGLRADTTYTVSEQPNALYDVEINGVPATSAVGTISDTALSVAKFQNTLKLTSFAVKKEWTGLAEGETAPAITLTLYCNGTIYPVATPAPDQNGWYTYTNLPSVVNGKAAVYTVKEEPLTGFTTTYLNKGEHADATDCAYNGGTIVNSKIPQTGDTTPLALWMLTTLLAACGLAGVTVAARKREN